jgi:hypothetical protein
MSGKEVNAMKRLYTMREREYFADHGWKFNADGMLTLTAKQAAESTGMSVRIPGKRTLMVPADTGLVLLIEDRHFIIEK